MTWPLAASFARTLTWVRKGEAGGGEGGAGQEPTMLIPHTYRFFSVLLVGCPVERMRITGNSASSFSRTLVGKVHATMAHHHKHTYTHTHPPLFPCPCCWQAELSVHRVRCLMGALELLMSVSFAPMCAREENSHIKWARIPPFFSILAPLLHQPTHSTSFLIPPASTIISRL